MSRVGWLTLAESLQDARLQPRPVSLVGLLAAVAAEQSGQAFLRKTLAPAIDKRVVAGQLLADPGPSLSGLEQQNQARSARWRSSARPA